MVDRSGYRDWLVQRFTALFIGAYAIFIIFYLFAYQPISYVAWHSLFSHFSMKVATFIVLLSILWHAWIGIWTVLTDYVKSRPVRLVIEVIVCLLLLAYLAWTFEILWVVV